MAHKVDIHEAQTSILHELLFHPDAGFAELQKPTGLSSDHFTLHIKRLIKLGYVEKAGTTKYKLSAMGKEHANRLDTDNNTIERQPKSAVILAISKPIESHTNYLFQERTKHPYYGFYGFPSGKIRWGETVIEAAARELMEETGLEADLEFKGVYHEHTYSKETGDLLEDKIFFVVKGVNPKGTLMKKFEGGINRWMKTADVAKKDKVYDSYFLELEVAEGKHQFIESDSTYSKDKF